MSNFQNFFREEIGKLVTQFISGATDWVMLLWYTDDIRDVQTRKCTTQIRLSAHKFANEQWRYKNIPKEQRICNLCCNNLVGDEFHYLFVCNKFSLRQRRQTFINDLLKVNTNFIKFDKKNLLITYYP